MEKEKIISYEWNDEIGNYCMTNGKRGRKREFIMPLKQLLLRNVSKSEFADTLQMIYYKRTGMIDDDIGFNHDYDVALAKKLNCY